MAEDKIKTHAGETETPKSFSELREDFDKRYGPWKRNEKSEVFPPGIVGRPETFSSYAVPNGSNVDGMSDFLLDAAQLGFSFWGSVKLDGDHTIVVLKED